MREVNATKYNDERQPTWSSKYDDYNEKIMKKLNADDKNYMKKLIKLTFKMIARFQTNIA